MNNLSIKFASKIGKWRINTLPKLQQNNLKVKCSRSQSEETLISILNLKLTTLMKSEKDTAGQSGRDEMNTHRADCVSERRLPPLRPELHSTAMSQGLPSADTHSKVIRACESEDASERICWSL